MDFPHRFCGRGPITEIGPLDTSPLNRGEEGEDTCETHCVDPTGPPPAGDRTLTITDHNTAPSSSRKNTRNSQHHSASKVHVKVEISILFWKVLSAGLP